MKPRIRIPLWLAALVPLVAYAIRAQFVRGGDWRPDMPLDAIAFGLLALVIAIVGVMRWRVARMDDNVPADAPEGDVDEDGRRW